MTRTAIAALLACLVLAVFAPGARGCSILNSDSSADYTQMARSAVNDLERNFWVGSPTDGHFAAACGWLEADIDGPGALWKQAQAYNVLYGWWKASGDEDAKTRLVANWNWIKRVDLYGDWSHCGWGTAINFASDDTGWNAGLALQAYDVTRDPQALVDAEAALDAAFARWAVNGPGGALWYNDARKVSSLYQATLALDSYEIFCLTREPRLLLYAISTYNWITSNLQRPDGLYWCDFANGAPVGSERPDDIGVAGSVSFLEGNMAMALLNARLYRATGDVEYSESAIRTTMAILNRQVEDDGVLMDDRDAWTNGYLVREWALEVLPLSPALSGGIRTVCKTASAIYAFDRTPYGGYGGDWSGPSDPSFAQWGSHGVTPQQVMTSANAVNNIIAAAAIAGVPSPTERLLDNGCLVRYNPTRKDMQ